MRCITIIAFLLLTSFNRVTVPSSAVGADQLDAIEHGQRQPVIEDLRLMSLSFTENRGQFPDKICFRANASGASFFFSPDEVVYQFTRRNQAEGGSLELGKWRSGAFQSPFERKENSRLASPVEHFYVKAKFIGANPNPEIKGEGLMEHKCNYFIGNDPARWCTDIPNYGAVVYRNIYPGIDLKYYGDGRAMKYDFIVAAGADPSQIQVCYEGVKSLQVNLAGELMVEMEFGVIIEDAPSIFQIIDGIKNVVQGGYLLTGENTFGFRLAQTYNSSYPLIIDPCLSYSTYLGGSDSETATYVAVDSFGHAYVTGYTASSDFPVSAPFDSMLDGDQDAFVAKLSASGDSLVYCTFLGGSDAEGWSSIDVTGDGSAFIAGNTFSPNFPTVNATDSSYNGDGDAFVARLSPAGNSLVYSTFLGGSSWDHSWAIAVDTDGNAYVTGKTESSDFPTANPFDSTLNGNSDIIVTKLSSSGDLLLYSTYLGGSEHEEGWGIATAGGNTYVSGLTLSSDFPTANPFDSTLDGFSDAVIAKLSPSGNSLVYSTYLGGSDQDYAVTIAIREGNAYIVGWTMSPDLPTTSAFDSTWNGQWDAFVSKISASGDWLEYCTYLGGELDDWGGGIGVDNDGNAFVNGQTSSSNFPAVNAVDSALGGSQDAFVSKISETGESLLFSTYLGGSGDDEGLHLAVDADGNAYSVGWTESSDYPAVNPFDSTFAGESDVIVSKLRSGSGAGFIAEPRTGTTPLAVHFTDISCGNPTSWFWDFGDDSSSTEQNPTHTYSDTGHFDISLVISDGIHTDSMVREDYIHVFDSIPFAPPVKYGVGSEPTSVFAADLDGDSHQDMVVANNESANISVLLNWGDGTFRHAVNYDAGSAPWTLVCADLDGDSDADIAVVDSGTSVLSVLLNQGKGDFQDAVSYDAGGDSRCVASGDLDGDLDIDLIVANWSQHHVSILFNNGNGTFQSPVNHEVGPYPRWVFCADFDANGYQDIVATSSGSIVSVLLNNGSGEFQPPIPYEVGYRPQSVFSADVDGDSSLDLAAANWYPDGLSVLLNNGGGDFQTSVNYGSDGILSSVFCADLDGDLDLDIVASEFNSPARVIIFKNAGDGTFVSRTEYSVGGSFGMLTSVFCTDFDGDSDFDIAVSDHDSVCILKNMTQLAANSPPWHFSLITPSDEDTTFGPTAFRWQIPYDPNFGDRIRYDLYVSTDPGFDPGFTVVYDSLPLSRFTDTLDTDTYYWKVRAYDNWGAETWSSETWSFITLLALPLALDPGWQWISCNIDPVPSEIETLFVDCWSGHLDLIKAEDGSFCIPDEGCWIPGWNVLEMYEIHMADACTIGVRGSKAQVDTEIPLESGWNYLGYLPDCSLEPETALASIWDNLDIVKNDDGDFCIPEIVCGIECLQKNEGYKGHLSAADTLIYPTDCPPCPSLFAKRISSLGFGETGDPKTHPQCETPEHFVFKSNTGDSYPVVIDSAILDTLELEECDEIGVFADTGDAKGLLCVGASVYHPADLPVPLTAWKDDPFTPERDGYLAGDSMYFKVWSYGQEREEYASSHYEVGNGLFEFEIYSKLWLSAPVVGPPDFAMEANPDSHEVQATGYVEYEVVLTSLHGFSSSCTLTVEGVPDDASAFFDPEVLTPTDTSVLTVNTSYTTPPGTYQLTLIGTEMGGKGAQQSVEVELVVTPAPDFEMQADPDIYETQAGDSAIFDLKLTSLYGFDSPCTLWISGLPPDASAQLDDIVLIPTDSTVLRMSTEYSTPPGEYDLTVTAQEMGGTFIQHSIDVTLEVLHSDTLWITAYSPVDLIVTDPVGDSIGLEFNTIQDATYDTLLDVNEDGDNDDLVTIPHCLIGDYLIRIISEPNAAPGDSYSLGIRINGSAETPPLTAPAPPQGESHDYVYTSLPYLRGDANGDNVTDLGDAIFELNYLFKSGPAPDPLELGDVNCDGIVDIGDAIYLLNYLFKGGDPPCS